jgi:hypothetical protein
MSQKRKRSDDVNLRELLICWGSPKKSSTVNLLFIFWGVGINRVDSGAEWISLD